MKHELTKKIVLFNVIVIQWVISPDSNSPGSSKNDSQHLGTQQDDPDSMPASSRRLGSIRHGTISVDQMPHYAVDGNQDTRSLRRVELTSVAMIDQRSRRSTTDDSVSMDTLPSVKMMSLRKGLELGSSLPGQQNQMTEHVAVPEEVRLRGANLHLSRIWRPNPL